MTQYIIGGVDLSGFAEHWLASLKRDDAPARGLLDHVTDGYDYGAHFMMANIGPHAVEPDASNEVLLLYAVLAVFQNDDFPGCDDRWQSAIEHLDCAFTYATQLGDRGLAQNLLKTLANRSNRAAVTIPDEMRARFMNHDPAQSAAHDRDMANIQSRDARAALLLDPTVSFDEMLLR